MMKSDELTCSLCGGKASLVREEGEVRIGRRLAVLEEEFVRCLECEEEYTTPEQMEQTQRRAVEQIRQREGLLVPSEIRATRAKYSLTQSELETLLGVGPKTVVRWEAGTVFQNAATDTLLRLIDSEPVVVRRLAEWRGVDVTVPEEETVLANAVGTYMTFAVALAPREAWWPSNVALNLWAYSGTVCRKGVLSFFDPEVREVQQSLLPVRKKLEEMREEDMALA